MVVAEGLSGAEQQVWNAFPAGRLVDLGTGIDADDDPEHGSEWGEARQVSADVLLALLCGQVDVPAGQSGRIWLRNARIIGKISFQNGELRYPLLLEQCYIGDGISLEDSTIPALSLMNCHIGPVNLRRTKVNGTVDLAGTLVEGGDGPNASGFKAKRMRAASDVGCTV